MATQTFPLNTPALPQAQTLIPRIDANPRVVAFAQTTAGKLAILASAAVLFYFRGVRDPLVLILLAGIFFLPRHTWTFMAIGGIYWIPSMIKGGFSLEQRAIGMALALGVAALLWLMVDRWPKGLVGRSPRLALLGVFAAAVGAAALFPTGRASIVMWALVAALSACLWIFSFALTDRAGAKLWLNASMFFSFFPAALASTTPFF